MIAEPLVAQLLDDHDPDAEGNYIGDQLHALTRIHRRTPMDGVRKAEGG